jgi:hypothetical protein
VIAPPLAAMFDAEAFPDPSRFDPSRPFQCYLHFGFGPRRCFGQYIAETALQNRPVNFHIDRPAPFVKVRGGAYFFPPGNPGVA